MDNLSTLLWELNELMYGRSVSGRSEGDILQEAIDRLGSLNKVNDDLDRKLLTGMDTPTTPEEFTVHMTKLADLYNQTVRMGARAWGCIVQTEALDDGDRSEPTTLTIGIWRRLK